MTRTPQAIDQKIATRLGYLDITKGLLVVIMVIYHTLNYSTQYSLAFRYISFLPPSFLFITGFVICVVYPNRPESSGTSHYHRLLIRGGKLIGLFTLLNLAVHGLYGALKNSTIGGIASVLSNWEAIYIRGNNKSTVFEILLPIGYFLLTTPILLYLLRRSAALLVSATLALILACLHLNQMGHPNSILTFVSVGPLGMLLGLFASRSPDALKKWSALILCFVLYLIFFPLGIHLGYNYLVQLFGATAAVALLITLSIKLKYPEWLLSLLSILGQYSLFAYIAQIAILQFIHILIDRQEPVSIGILAVFATTLFLTTAAVELIRYLRKKFIAIDIAYRTFFA